MDRRSEQRHDSDIPVELIVLGSAERRVPAVLRNISGTGARLRVEEPIPVDSALRFDLGDSMLLGEVCYCASDSGAFAIGVELRHSLVNLAEVAKLRERVLMELSAR